MSTDYINEFYLFLDEQGLINAFKTSFDTNESRYLFLEENPPAHWLALMPDQVSLGRIERAKLNLANKLWGDKFMDAPEIEANLVAVPEANQTKRTHYHVEIIPGVWVDVYDVIDAWGLANPAYQHLIKKALKPGNRGHKDMMTDAQDIIDSAVRGKELIEKAGD